MHASVFVYLLQVLSHHDTEQCYHTLQVYFTLCRPTDFRDTEKPRFDGDRGDLGFWERLRVLAAFL